MLTVAELANNRPLSIKVLQRHGIDFRGGGGRSLDHACAAQAIAVQALLAEVTSEEAAAQPDGEPWDTAPLSTLVEHIVQRHHRPLDVELPRLSLLVHKVTQVHRDTDPARMDALRRTWANLVADLVLHMLKEERLIFPTVLADLGHRAGSQVSAMVQDHAHLEVVLAKLRRLTDDYVAPPGASADWCALWQGLKALDADLHAHMHLENDVLFPRAVRA